MPSKVEETRLYSAIWLIELRLEDEEASAFPSMAQEDKEKRKRPVKGRAICWNFLVFMMLPPPFDPSCLSCFPNTGG